jgi:hypothetical protein
MVLVLGPQRSRPALFRFGTEIKNA